jgi:uncharacterized membrane protein YdjX (TVP38/TMEM64 family)
MNNKQVKIAGFFLGLVILIMVGKLLGITTIINNILQSTLNWVNSLGFLAPIGFIFIYIIASVLLISGAVLTLGAGVLFGVIKGSIFVSIASTLAATTAFLIGRYLARNWVSKQIETQPKFAAIDSAVGKEGWKIVGLTRLSPVFPFVFLNYAFSVTKVSLKDYVLASWLGMIPGTIMYVYIGSLAVNFASLGAGNTAPNMAQWGLRIVGFLATLAVTIYVTKIAKNALDNELNN